MKTYKEITAHNRELYQAIEDLAQVRLKYASYEFDCTEINEALLLLQKQVEESLVELEQYWALAVEKRPVKRDEAEQAYKDQYVSIVRAYKANPNRTQKDIANSLDLKPHIVARALTEFFRWKHS